jgi:hypothetical protein
MAETAQLIQLMKEQMEQAERRHQEQLEELRQQRREDLERSERDKEEMRRQHKEQMDALAKAQGGSTHVSSSASTSTPAFSPFDPTSELWTDYWSRFCTFAGANTVPDHRKAQVFLTNQSSATYKLLANLAAQQSPPKDINLLSMDEIVSFMKDQYDPRRFIVRERFKFWSDMQRKPGETIQELAARIRQDAATCDFPSIKDPQDEAMRTRFICSVSNEAVLKALFKVKDDELDFARAVHIALETEDAAQVAKETAYGRLSMPSPVYKVESQQQDQGSKASSRNWNKADGQDQAEMCYRCGKSDHRANKCKHARATCNYCRKTGHLEKVCRMKKSENGSQVKRIFRIDLVPLQKDRGSWVSDEDTLPRLEVPLQISDHTVQMELDTATMDNFVDKDVWTKLGNPELREPRRTYESASMHEMPMLGSFIAPAKTADSDQWHSVMFTVADVPGLNILGRSALFKLDIPLDKALKTVSADANGAWGESSVRRSERISGGCNIGSDGCRRHHRSTKPTVVQGEGRTAERPKHEPFSPRRKKSKKNRRSNAPTKGIAELRVERVPKAALPRTDIDPADRTSTDATFPAHLRATFPTETPAAYNYKGGTPCYVRHSSTPGEELAWLPAIVMKRIDDRRCKVRILPGGTTWIRRRSQLRPRPTIDGYRRTGTIRRRCRQTRVTRTGVRADGSSTGRDDPLLHSRGLETHPVRSQADRGGVVADATDSKASRRREVANPAHCPCSDQNIDRSPTAAASILVASTVQKRLGTDRSLIGCCFQPR